MAANALQKKKIRGENLRRRSASAELHRRLSAKKKKMLALAVLACGVGVASAAGHVERVEWGDRVKYLVEDMEASDLKTSLQACLDDAKLRPFTHDFSIGHRGACLQYPEHTQESYVAAMYQGAGIVECDVAVPSLSVVFLSKRNGSIRSRR